MRSFTIEVYSCEQCPHADHDGGMCQEYLNSRFSVYGESLVEDYTKAEKIYSENCHELCSSCPRVQ